MINKKNIATMIVFLFIVLILNFFYIAPSIGIAKGSGTVLSDNWWQALNWIKNNTAECSTVATYWDPGHFITGIASRPVVFDGASQGAIRTIELTGEVTEDQIKEAAVIDQYTVEETYEDGEKVTKITTARIQDIATSLMTTDEDMSLNILKKYVKPGCKEMYYIASSDLIGKSVWWSYFATWNPIDKGKQYSYSILSLSQSRQIIEQNSMLYVYPASKDQTFILLAKNETLTALFQQGNLAPVKVEKLVYFLNDGTGISKVAEDAEIKGMVWVDPSYQIIVYAPPEISDSMFTRMFFLNGQGLKNFEFVGSWGGEVKLFKVKIS